jgi:lipase chaperone LimK
MSVSMAKSKQAKQKIPVSTVVVLLGLVMLVLFFFSIYEPKIDNNVVDIVPVETGKLINSEKNSTIETAWQWRSFPDNKPVGNEILETNVISELGNAMSQSTLNPFTQESVYNALKSVKLDEKGDVMIDNDALNALNETLEKPNIKLDDDALIALQEIIRGGLPGSAGAQVAQVVADYYHYLGAQKEFNAIYEVENQLPIDQDSKFENQIAQYNELLALRELYLGEEVANKLFATSNATALYMFESLALDNNKTLTNEEKKQQQSDITQRHAEQTIAIINWNERYHNFMTDKQYVLDASLGDDEKRKQLRQLMSQYFNNEELTQVKHLQLDSL